MVESSAIFDTNILIDYLNGVPEAKVALTAYGFKPAISVITWIEVMVGAKRFGHEQQTKQFLSGFDVLPVNQAVSEQAVETRQEYGMKLPDAIILATATVNLKRLISRNSKDFKNIPGVVMPY
ncbi:type II toxin-antitoxin system VapC family toxin [Buttiauxella selenatireducens]|uniref:Type II toxin-antitoxin system VapC family toxin n=1 Tax=Buttiauxella selenatireducens TaxID=3073902 RepID=A0ABY9SAX0_9ENTR|nr:type II toxin-antitoxin system VapC family toxin [Buttiauxella sp. R73]WMY74657.1 type II toxin-antitoxin system VapC family toxin [Buttiauxella sp. R73]